MTERLDGPGAAAAAAAADRVVVGTRPENMHHFFAHFDEPQIV